MKKLYFIFALLMLTILPTFAAEWVEIYPKIYMDKSSYEYNPSTKIAKVWIKELNNEKHPMENVNGKRVYYKKTYEEFNCTDRQLKLLSSVSYDLKDNVLQSFDNPYSMFSTLGWAYVVPDSVGEVLYREACSSHLK